MGPGLTQPWAVEERFGRAVDLFSAGSWEQIDSPTLRVLKVSAPTIVAGSSQSPKELRLIVVGGIGPDMMTPWFAAGADGFGLGSGIYRPGQTPADTLDKARAYQSALASR